jgi:hypothetical protein
MDNRNIKSKTNYRQALEERPINAEKVNRQRKVKRGNKNLITENYINTTYSYIHTHTYIYIYKHIYTIRTYILVHTHIHIHTYIYK